jgi:hypothetical protein
MEEGTNNSNNKNKRNSLFKKRILDFNKEEMKKILIEFKEEQARL